MKFSHDTKNIEQKIQAQLKYFTSGKLMEIFISPTHHKGMPNISTPTLGGHELWDTLWSVDGWKVQKCIVLEKMVCHYRILDPCNVRRAWTLSAKQFCHDLTLFTNIIRQTQLCENFRYGIVFSGGGGKGAYQIGVWRYLREIGVADKISGISGVSVGALNSLLFLQGDYEKASNLWLSIEQRDFTHIDISKYLRQIQKLILYSTNIPSFFIDQLIESIFTDPQKSKDISFSFFSQERLRQIIQENIKIDQVMNRLSDKMVYSMLYDIPNGAYPCLWNNRSFENITELVLTSAAIPGAYPLRCFDGRNCIDGGIVDNLPVAPLTKDFQHIIVVHLSPNTAKEQNSWVRSMKTVKNDNVSFYHVYPSTNKYMSSLKDTFTVSPDITQERMDLGYEDAKKQLRKILELEQYRACISKYPPTLRSLSSIRSVW